MHDVFSRRIPMIATGVCLLLLVLVPVASVGAQQYPYPYPSYPSPSYPSYPSNPSYPYPGAPPAVAPPLAPLATPSVATTTPTVTPVAPVAPATPVLPVAPVVSTSGYPPNALISSYFDPRYCGNGAVSVVTDAGGALINICTSTGQRVLPVYPDYVPVPYAPAVPYGTSAYTLGYYGNGAASGYNYGYTPYAASYNNGYASGFTGTRQYTDNNSNCPNGDVTQTSSGFFCTANGAPAVRVR